MKRLHVKGLAALVFGLLPTYMALATDTNEAQTTSDAHSHHWHHSLRLPETTACIENILGKRLPPASPFPDLDIQRNRFADYVGHYQDRINVAGRAIVTLTPGGDLRVQFPDFDAAGVPYNPNLIPTSRDNFVVIVGDEAFRLTGIREGGKAIAHLRARVTVLSRTTGTGAAQRASVGIDRNALEKALRDAPTERETLR